jgi:hypothetical protein
VTDNSLAIIEHPAGTELALPDHLVEAARDFQREALAERTRQTYADAWRLFLGWCDTMGRRPLPASPQSVAGWLTELATGADGKKPRSAATVRLYLASIAYMHKINGAEFSTGHPEIKAAIGGISRRSSARIGFARLGMSVFALVRLIPPMAALISGCPVENAAPLILCI